MVNHPDQSTVDTATQAFAALRAIHRSGGRCSFPESHVAVLSCLQRFGRVVLTEGFDVCGREWVASEPTRIYSEVPF